MLGATWFLQILFLIIIIHSVIEYFIKNYKHKEIIQLTISIIFLITGYILAIHNIDLKIIPLSVLTCYILYVIPTLRIWKKAISRNNVKFAKYRILVLIVSFGALLIFNKYGTIEISKNIYTNPIYFMCVSILGYILIYEISYYISKVKILSVSFQYIGRNTMPILFLHFIAFKIVNLIGILILNDDITLLGTFPVLYKENFWWILYTIFGIGIPLIINLMVTFIKKKIKGVME